MLLVRAAFVTGVTSQHSSLLRSVLKTTQLPCVSHSSLVCGDSSPTRLLEKYLVDIICGCCELVSVSPKSAEDLNCWCVVWNPRRILLICDKSSTQLEPTSGNGAVSDRCLRTSNSAGDGDVECRRWIQEFLWCWGKRERSEAMENVVSVEDDHNDNAHQRGQTTVCVLDAGWRCADGSGTLGVRRILG